MLIFEMIVGVAYLAAVFLVARVGAEVMLRAYASFARSVGDVPAWSPP
jgi:hypothetical protein